MSARSMVLPTGAVLAAIALTGCSSPGNDASATEPVTTTVTVTAAPDSATAPETPPAAPNPAGDCTFDHPGTRAIVVQGAVDCTTLTDVWAAAVTDPAFAVHGNRNTVVVGDWTCRAHETTPLQTGFCQDGSYRNKFKVVRAG